MKINGQQYDLWKTSEPDYDDGPEVYCPDCDEVLETEYDPVKEMYLVECSHCGCEWTYDPISEELYQK
jgi:hypothetical protein